MGLFALFLPWKRSTNNLGSTPVPFSSPAVTQGKSFAALHALLPQLLNLAGGNGQLGVLAVCFSPTSLICLAPRHVILSPPSPSSCLCTGCLLPSDHAFLDSSPTLASLWKHFLAPDGSSQTSPLWPWVRGHSRAPSCLSLDSSQPWALAVGYVCQDCFLYSVSTVSKELLTHSELSP